MLQLAVFIVLLELYLIQSNNRVSPPASKAKLNYHKARVISTRSNLKENKLNNAKSTSQYSKSETIPRLLSDNYPVFELFVRTAGSPWLRYKDILGKDELIISSSSRVIEGGLIAEFERQIIDAWLSFKIFGKGFGILGGEAESISEVKSVLPAYKKVRGRDIEFGYRLKSDEEEIYSIAKSTDLIENNNLTLENDSKLNEAIKPETIDLNANNSFYSSFGCEKFTYWIETLNGLYIREKISEIAMYCDGSACYSGSYCTAASTGLLIIPISSSSSSSSTSTDSSKTASSSSSSTLLCQMKNNTKINGSKSFPSELFSLSISNAAGALGTPFDAELMAGLACTYVASILSEAYYNESNNRLLKISMYTDSRALRRLILNGLQEEENKNSDVSNFEHESIELETEKNKNTKDFIPTVLLSNRNFMTKSSLVNINKVINLNLNIVTEGESFFDLKWIPGHPERREPDRQKWNLNDLGIYICDEIAKSGLNTHKNSQMMDEKLLNLDKHFKDCEYDIIDNQHSSINHINLSL